MPQVLSGGKRKVAKAKMVGSTAKAAAVAKGKVGVTGGGTGKATKATATVAGKAGIPKAVGKTKAQKLVPKGGSKQGSGAY
jgi:hypothetical protein